MVYLYSVCGLRARDLALGVVVHIGGVFCVINSLYIPVVDFLCRRT